MPQPEPFVDQLSRLAARVVAGDVVFFIGAGFSLDSERNTAGVLIARLLARLDALIRTVLASPACRDSDLGQVARDLDQGLVLTFRLNKDADGLWGDHLESNIDRLASDYYLINDWMCSAFEALLKHWQQLEPLADAIHQAECMLLARYQTLKTHVNDTVPERAAFARYSELLTERSHPEPLTGARPAAGKAHFLDAMGFMNTAVMAGSPHTHRLDDVIDSYEGRLRPRHHVLAWLALEGVLPVLVTTNYDLLLEGAYRLAGMDSLLAVAERRQESDAIRRNAALPWNRRLRYFMPIADATQFFSYGDGHQAALILKLHGCAFVYRRETCSADRWRAILPTMVFTFREIQNWRDASWSRDYLRSLLRTRTVAFAGYSGADQVIHDTVRSVYEEMARYRTERVGFPSSGNRSGQRDRAGTDRATLGPTGAQGVSPAGANANAFFMDMAPKREFHALELLRAASLAAGDPCPAPVVHPNLLVFNRSDTGQFPTLDETMSWTFHLTYRNLQRQALDGELRRVAYQLFGGPSIEDQARSIIESFNRVCSLELAHAGSRQPQALRESHADLPTPTDPAEHRTLMRQVVGWTVDFHRSLLREFAAADLLVRSPGQASRVHAAMRWPWYAPLNEHPDWAAWAVVLELAIRRRAAQWAGFADEWLAPAAWAEPALADRPAVLVPQAYWGSQHPAPRVALTIEVPEIRSLATTRHGARPINFLPRVRWLLQKHAIPWWPRSDERRIIIKDIEPWTIGEFAPDAETIWAWAVGQFDLKRPERPYGGTSAARFFNDTDVRDVHRLGPSAT
jgi:hypothetical protein